jgi:hypothetical protein
MIATTKPLSEITQEAIAVLLREIGIINTVRFLNQFTGGFGNYTEERDALFGKLTMEEILVDIDRDQDIETNKPEL